MTKDMNSVINPPNKPLNNSIYMGRNDNTSTSTVSVNNSQQVTYGHVNKRDE